LTITKYVSFAVFLLTNLLPTFAIAENVIRDNISFKVILSNLTIILWRKCFLKNSIFCTVDFLWRIFSGGDNEVIRNFVCKCLDSPCYVEQRL